MKIQWNDDAFEKMQRQVAEKIEAADREIRSRCTGKKQSEVEPVAKSMLNQIGVTLPASDLTAYSTAVANGQPFEFVLR